VRPRGRYCRNVERALDWLDRRLQPSNVEDDGLDRFLPQAPDHDAAKRAAAAPFGWPLLDLTLRPALAYPVLLLIVTWVLGGEGRLGDDLVILSDEAPPWARIAMLTAVALFALSFVLPSRRRLVVQLVAVAVAVAAATRRGRGLCAYLLLVLCGIAAMLTIVALAPELDEFFTTLLLFLVLLPFVNALFDYLSIGTTRALLRQGKRLPGRALVFGTLDVGLAFGFFALLRGVLVVLVVAMNAVAGTDVVDLQSLFADLRSGERAGDYWGLYATIFSTLVHFSIALWSLGAQVPGAVRGWLANGVDAAECDACARTGAVLGLTALATWTLLLPPTLTVGAGWLLVSWFPALGAGYLWLFERLAELMGATVEPGPGLVDV
jgi:hypothetical protein